MLNKRVLLGSLVAGAMLLPMTASAGVVNGACVNCHTMHQTNGAGGARTGGAQLLTAGNCAGCHATGNGNDANGVYNNGSFSAPQVDDAAAPNLAGYFNTAVGATAQQMHNITDDISGLQPETEILPPGAPGSPTNRQNFVCAGCHTLAAGGHHGNAGSTYRMLFDANPAISDQVEDVIYGNTQTVQPSVQATTYDSDQMNDVCKICHSNFHTLQGSTASWIRHPTDIDLVSANALATYSYTGNYGPGSRDLIPVGTSSSVQAGTATGTQTIMCITCHYSHGGANADLLRFNYSANIAGNDTLDAGCENCHSYGATLTPGM